METRVEPSHTFRLLRANQSETIPACLKRQLVGRQVLKGRARFVRVEGNVPARAESRSPKKMGKELLSTGFSHLWKWQRIFIALDDDCNSAWTGSHECLG